MRCSCPELRSPDPRRAAAALPRAHSRYNPLPSTSSAGRRRTRAGAAPGAKPGSVVLGDTEISQAIHLAALAAGRTPGAAEAEMAERLKANWYLTAADVAAMTQEELQLLKVPVKLWHLLTKSLEHPTPPAAQPTLPGAGQAQGAAPAKPPSTTNPPIGTAGKAVQSTSWVSASVSQQQQEGGQQVQDGAIVSSAPRHQQEGQGTQGSGERWADGGAGLSSMRGSAAEAASGSGSAGAGDGGVVGGSSALIEDIMLRRMPASSRSSRSRAAAAVASPAGSPNPPAAPTSTASKRSAVLGVRRKALRCTAPYGLKESELSDGLREELQRLEHFCTKSFYGQQVQPIKPVTYKTVTRFYVMLMLGWQRDFKGVPAEQLSLSGLLPSPRREAVSLLMEYQQWRERERGCSSSSQVNAIKACIALARFLYHDLSKPDPDRRVPPYHDLELVLELSRMMRAAQRIASRAPRVADESRKWLEWEQYLGVVRALRAECAGLTAAGAARPGRHVALSLQRYLIFAILSAIPDRQRTLRELEVGRTLIKDPAGRWVIRHGPDDYKTGKQYGERPLMVIPPFIYPELEAFIGTWRQELRPQHNCLFCRPRDGSPLTVRSMTHLFTSTALRLTGQATNPHLVRDMVVTSLRSRGCSEVEMESLALYMGHSLTVQRSTYDRRTHAQKVAPAQELLLGLSSRFDRS